MATIVNPSDNLQEFKNRVNLDGVKAVEPTRCERFAILLDPLSSGTIGRGIVAGVAPVRVNVIREPIPSPRSCPTRRATFAAHRTA